MSHAESSRWRLVLGWLAVSVSIAFTCFWAFWGIIENFHEGWYQPSWFDRIAMMLAQYLSFMLAFLFASLVSIRWPRVGAALHLAAGLFALWFFWGARTLRLVVPPMWLLAAGYWFGRVEPRKWAVRLAIVLPLIVLIACGIEPAIRAAMREDDGDRSARHLGDNGLDLIWAAEGPGWPSHGMSWSEAMRQCQHLNADGRSVAQTPQNVWRLPTVDEAVRAQCLHGENGGGTWDPTTEQVAYRRWPDKETPLWNPQSKVIYWWTATEVSETQAYTISYRGRVNRRDKDLSHGYRAFRAVKQASAGDRQDESSS